MASSLLTLVSAQSKLIRTVFTSASLNPALKDALKSANIEDLTWIQKTVLPHILDKKNVAFADQTGTGKTIAYLLPLLNIVKFHEQESRLFASPGFPRAVILAPSRELALQIGDVAKMFSHHIKLSTRLVIGGKPISQQKKAFHDPIDIVIATPGRLRQLLNERCCHLNHLKTMVFDEADTLFDPRAGFLDEIQNGIFKRLPRPSDLQFVCVSATLNKQTIGRLRSKFANLKIITSNQLHKIPSTLKVDFLHTGGKDKLTQLISLVTDIQPHYRRIVVFCNTVESCRAVEHGLREAGLNNVTSIHGGILPRTRQRNFEAFSSNAKPVLVATDISCRGIDLPDSTSIIMFDFPSELTEFLHRAGRTARIGNDGMVYVLTTKRDQIQAKKLKSCIEAGVALDLSGPTRHAPEKASKSSPKHD